MSMIKPTKSNKQYEDALARIYTLIQKDIKPYSRASDALEVLSILVKEYEHANLPKAHFHFPDMLQEDLILASAWQGSVRTGFSPDEAYQGPAASEQEVVKQCVLRCR